MCAILLVPFIRVSVVNLWTEEQCDKYISSMLSHSLWWSYTDGFSLCARLYKTSPVYVWVVVMLLFVHTDMHVLLWSSVGWLLYLVALYDWSKWIFCWCQQLCIDGLIGRFDEYFVANFQSIAVCKILVGVFVIVE